MADNCPVDLSIIYLIFVPDNNLHKKFQQMQDAIRGLGLTAEILVVNFREIEPVELPKTGNTILRNLSAGSYGLALQNAINRSQGEFILSMDNDHSDPAQTLVDLWHARHQADVVIASRYIAAGNASVTKSRYFFSRLFNIAFSRGLDLGVKDMSSGFRIYRGDILRSMQLSSANFSVLQEILVYFYTEGYHIHEVPFTYCPGMPESRFRRVFKFSLDYLQTFYRLWKLRNSIESADYDARAYDTWLVPQRYWQRQRYKHISDFVKPDGPCLDVGCGSSNIIGMLPDKSVALDILMRKLRYAQRYDQNLLNASALRLPVRDASFQCVICSQLIEHIPRGDVLDELDRVLAPGGRLVLGTPDYSKWQWLLIEYIYGKVLPQAYADEHITHYSYTELFQEFVIHRNYELIVARYILQGELIMAFNKLET